MSCTKSLVKNLVKKVVFARNISRILKLPLEDVHYDKIKEYNEDLYNRDLNNMNWFLYRHPYVTYMTRKPYPNKN